MNRVMLVEDNSLMRMSIKRILNLNNYQIVAEAVNGEEALSKYRLFKPDIVIMDINMPKRSGMDAIKDIMTFDPSANIVVCSIVDSQERIIEAIQSGVKGYIVKPFKYDDLLDAIKKVAVKS